MSNITDIKNDLKAIRKKAEISEIGNYAILYHGTSKKSANQIKETGFFRDGFFFPNKNRNNDDNVFSYAKIRAKQNNESGTGEILKMQVDLNSFHVNIGTGEIESDGDLFLHSNNIWYNKKEEFNNINFKTSEEISKDLNLNLNFSRLLINSLRDLYYNKHITDKKDLYDNIINLMYEFKDKSDRSLKYLVKTNFNMSVDEFNKNIDIILKLKNINVFLDTKNEQKILKFNEYLLEKYHN